jgi:ribosomal protein L29
MFNYDESGSEFFEKHAQLNTNQLKTLEFDRKNIARVLAQIIN